MVSERVSKIAKKCRISPLSFLNFVKVLEDFNDVAKSRFGGSLNTTYNNGMSKLKVI